MNPTSSKGLGWGGENLQQPGLTPGCCDPRVIRKPKEEGKHQGHGLRVVPPQKTQLAVEPRMLRVFLDKVVPKTYTILVKDTLLATLMHKKFAQPAKNTIPVLTTREDVGKTTPSKHETSYGVQCRFLCIIGPDVKYDIDRTNDCDSVFEVHFVHAP